MRLRSLLFVPGDRPDRMQKALTAGADALILDLEDAVAATAKSRARRDVAGFLARGPRRIPCFVRTNPLQSGLIEHDLDALAGTAPEGWVLPKAEGAESIANLVVLLSGRGMSPSGILPIASETARAVFRLGQYADVAGHLAGVTWGAEDLPAAIGAATAREADGRFTPPYEMVRALTLFAAHAAQVPAIDTVYPAFHDTDGLTGYAARAARDGFNGMLAIHPVQVGVINAAFTPSPEVLERARRIVAAFDAAPGAGVLEVDGSMVDAPHLKRARRTLEQAAADSAGD